MSVLEKINVRAIHRRQAAPCAGHCCLPLTACCRRSSYIACFLATPTAVHPLAVCVRICRVPIKMSYWQPAQARRPPLLPPGSRGRPLTTGAEAAVLLVCRRLSGRWRGRRRTRPQQAIWACLRQVAKGCRLESMVAMLRWPHERHRPCLCLLSTLVNSTKLTHPLLPTGLRPS